MEELKRGLEKWKQMCKETQEATERELASVPREAAEEREKAQRAEADAERAKREVGGMRDRLRSERGEKEHLEGVLCLARTRLAETM